jgi:hypothetical protein
MSEKKKHEPEYTLHILHTKHPETGADVTAFIVQTVREFVSFSYDIPLESTIEGREIGINIRGLRVPENLVPGKGQARGIFYHPRLMGTYDVLVTNVDGVVNKFEATFGPKVVEVKRASRKPFIVYGEGRPRQ